MFMATLILSDVKVYNYAMDTILYAISSSVVPQCLHVLGHVTTDRTGSWQMLGFTEHPCVSRSLHAAFAENEFNKLIYLY